MDDLVKTMEEKMSISHSDVEAIMTPGDSFMKTTEGMTSFSHGDVEAIMKSGQIWAAGCQTISQTMAATAQARLDQIISTWKALSSVKSLQEAIDLQTGLARAPLETAFAETGKLTEASMRLAEQTMAPLTARMTLLITNSTRDPRDETPRAFPSITNKRPRGIDETR
jgi:phasin family protein